jgi:tetratricopeptide (TPR) repeat protein
MLHDDRLLATLLSQRAIAPGSHPEDVVDAANALEALGQPEQAQRLFEERIRRFPAETTTRLQLASLLDRAGNAPAAVAAWKELEKHLPVDQMTTGQALAYARALARTGETDGATRVLKASRAKATSEDREFWENLAVLAWQADDSAEALVAYRVLWANHDRAPGVGQRLMTLAIESGSIDEAIAVGTEDYRATGRTESLLTAAELRSRSGDWKAVDRILRIAAPSGTAGALKKEEFWLLRAEAYGALGEEKAAADAFRVALALNPASSAAQAALLWDAIHRDDEAALRQYLVAWRANAAASAELWPAYAVALDRVGRVGEAAAIYQKQLREQPNDPTLALELADALKRAGYGTVAWRVRRLAAARLARDAPRLLGSVQLTEQDQQRLEFETTIARDTAGADVGERWYRALRRRNSSDSAAANAFRFDWFLADGRFDDARRELRGLRPEQPRRSGAGEYRLALALAEDDYQTLGQVLTDSTGVDSGQRIDALVALERDGLAANAIGQALVEDSANEHPEWRDKLAELHYQHAPTWRFGAGYEDVTGLVGYGPDLSAAYDLGPARMFVSGFGRRLSVRNGSLILDAPVNEADADVLARFSQRLGVTEVAVGGNVQPAHDGNRQTPLPRASFYDRRLVTPVIGTTVRIVADDRIEDTGLLRLAAVRSQVDVGARAELGSAWYASFGLLAREDHSRELRHLANEIGEEGEVGYKISTHAPEWDVGIEGLAHQRRNVRHIPTDVAAFLPGGADLALYMPPSFQLVSIVTHLTRGESLERYRPDRSSFPRYDCEGAAGILFPDLDPAVHLQCSVSIRLSTRGYASALGFYNRGFAGIYGQQSAEAALSYSLTF